MYYSMQYDSPIGAILLVADETHLVGLWINGQKHFCPLKEQSQRNDARPVLQDTKKWLDDYFAGEKPEIDLLPLRPQGSAFQQEVWDILKDIPYGETTTYGEIAKKIAVKRNKNTMSAQAVGGAVGRNPISIIIPCHRVIGKDGSLTGYDGGLDKKIWLLEHEGIECR